MKTNSDTSQYLASIASRRKSVLSRRGNERGQVAIFVALIFQVVFVFFALLINVGLLVHHKINLQHSTDLAAYYGAMKQAESMNAIAHINFQMRQAWKLLTWRYRVLGTFGFIPRTGPPSQVFPFQQSPGGVTEFTFNGSRGTYANNLANAYVNGPQAMNCGSAGVLVDGRGVGIQDIPFFCAGHTGFYQWPAGESLCQLDCAMFNRANVINQIPSVSTASTIFNGSLGSSMNTGIAAANAAIDRGCTALGPVGAKLLTKFLVAYNVESTLRSETIKMLAKNVSQDVGRMVDLDGSKVIDGSKRTFENNLTGANWTGLDRNESFKAYNGLSSQSCTFGNGRTPGRTEFLKKIEFKLINYFLHSCKNTGSGFEYEPKSLYTAAGIEPIFLTGAAGQALTSDEENFLLSLLDSQNLHTIGYEKNPNCVEYFAVKTFSEPTIPFLPLSKIRLEATAVAKPFGGSIGPAFGTNWPSGADVSQYSDNNADSKTDPTMPMRDFTPSGSAVTDLKQSIYRQPNFGLFVGDHLGLRNLDYLAAYHSMLAKRDIKNYPTKSYASNVGGFKLENLLAGSWPAFKNWENISQPGTDLRPYDTLASAASLEAGMRAVEITAIAPNQFDITYYSIEPDFFNNYYIKLFKNFSVIRNAAGNNVNLTANQLRGDFGSVDMDGNTNPVNDPPLTPKSFSVKDQILLKNIVLDDRPRVLPAPSYPFQGTSGNKYREILNYLVTYQTSLLTGWTFLHFNNYNKFPDQPVDKTANTMTFGQCDDPWNKVRSTDDPTIPSNFHNPMNENADNPPVPGNCVTGGRTGYSVKLVSPSVVLDQSLLLNPMPLNFFDF